MLKLAIANRLSTGTLPDHDARSAEALHLRDDDSNSESGRERAKSQRGETAGSAAVMGF